MKSNLIEFFLACLFNILLIILVGKEVVQTTAQIYQSLGVF